MAVLAAEGLDREKLALLAMRARRADQALEWAVERIIAGMPTDAWSKEGPIVLLVENFLRWPAEIALRLLRRAIDQIGKEGPAGLGQIEALVRALRCFAGEKRAGRLRRTLAGAVVTLSGSRLTVEPAPPRRPKRPPRS